MTTHPLDISDVWKTANSASSNQKIWAAKVTARHPNLVAVEISSFKCGHDAPIYSLIEQIVERSGTPYFSFKDLDENFPASTIKLRVETIDYFLKRYREDLLRRKGKGSGNRTITCGVRAQAARGIQPRPRTPCARLQTCGVLKKCE
ncbi:MAG TPA: hypothetical protein VEV41_03095 [Terriglobales bacterium]|nr:hypothetical protein [Terriglobales bacterium]